MNKRKINIVLIVVLLTVILSTHLIHINKKDEEKLPISRNSEAIKEPNLYGNHSQEYFELNGFGKLTIDKTNPYIHLINPSNNDVYLQYTVFNGDNVLYTTELIEPDTMVKFDIFNKLDAGNHSLTYVINVYDTNTYKQLWSGINQIQEIEIIK